MGDEFRGDEIREEELEKQTGGKQTAQTNEPLRPAGGGPTTLAVGEEEEQGDAGDKRRYL